LQGGDAGQILAAGGENAKGPGREKPGVRQKRPPSKREMGAQQSKQKNGQPVDDSNGNGDKYKTQKKKKKEEANQTEMAKTSGRFGFPGPKKKWVQKGGPKWTLHRRKPRGTALGTVGGGQGGVCRGPWSQWVTKKKGGIRGWQRLR